MDCLAGMSGFPDALHVSRCSGTLPWPDLFRRACSGREPSQVVGNRRLRKTPRTCFEGPFGEVIRATGLMAKANPFRFSTKYQDDETDLLYYGYRYYNLSTGRWLSRDPIVEWGGVNLYGFVLEDPIDFLDLLGIQDKPPIPNPVIPRNWPAPGPGQPPLPPPGIPPRAPPGAPTSGLPTAPVPPPSGTPPGGVSKPAPGLPGMVIMCSGKLAAVLDQWAFRAAIKKCTDEMKSKGNGSKCCVVLFCYSCGCLTGQPYYDILATYLADKPCAEAEDDVTDGNVLSPGCVHPNETPGQVYQPMSKP